ncbi:hypothetical protein ACHQM5_026644 [Ranunculus cassubicifolius]
MNANTEGLHNVPCESLAVDTVLRVAVAGTLWGLTTGPYDAARKGLTGLPKATYVARTTGSYGVQCGFFAGVYTITHCQLQSYREKNDWINAAVAGAVTGALFAVKTRSWRQVLGMSALVGSITTVADVATAIPSPL